MAVTVDIPGVGTVVADNAAQDSTLSSILAAIKSQSGDGGAADSQGVQALNSRSRQAGSSITKLSGSFGGLSETVAATAGGMSRVGRGMSSLMDSMTRSASRFGSITGESMAQSMGEINRVMSSAASAIPGAGKLLGPLAAGIGLISGAMAKQMDAYTTAAQSGFSFGYSMDNMRVIANDANLSMTQLTNVMQKSSSAMSLFGGGTTQGARQFATLNKQVQTNVGGVLLRMGVGFEEQGVRTADTIERLMLAGMSMDEIARSGDMVSRVTRDRVGIESQLAKINGTTLQQEREKSKAAQRDATLQMTLHGLQGKQKTQMTNLYKEMEATAPGMGKMALEFHKFGTISSKQSAQLSQMYPTMTKELENYTKGIKAGTDSRSFPEFLASLDKSAIERETASAADLGSQLALVGHSAGGLSETLQKSFLGIKEMGTKLGPDGAINKIINDHTELMKDAGKVTTAMVNHAKMLHDTGVELSKAMTAAIEGPMGDLVRDANLGMLKIMKLTAEGSGVIVKAINGLLKDIGSSDVFTPTATTTNGSDDADAADSGTPATPPATPPATAPAQSPDASSGSWFGDLFEKGTLGTGELMRDFGQGTLAMLHGREAVITENQMSNMFSNVNAFREGTFSGMADQMSKVMQAIKDGATTEEAMGQIEQIVPSTNVVHLSSQDRELLSQIAAGNALVANSINSVGMRQLEALDEVKMNTG